jgi:hypothetical protein
MSLSFGRAMPTSAGTLYIRSAICVQKPFFWGKVHYRLLYSLALDVEYDTQLHFSIVRHWHSDRSTEGKLRFEGY